MYEKPFGSLFEDAEPQKAPIELSIPQEEADKQKLKARIEVANEVIQAPKPYFFRTTDRKSVV